MTKRISIRSTKKVTQDLIKTIIGQQVRPALEEGDDEPRSGICCACGMVGQQDAQTADTSSVENTPSLLVVQSVLEKELLNSLMRKMIYGLRYSDFYY